MQPADVVYQQIIHSYSGKRAEKHNRRHLFISNCSAVPEEREKKKKSTQSDLNTKQTADSEKKKKNTSAVECLKIRLGSEITKFIITQHTFVLFKHYTHLTRDLRPGNATAPEDSCNHLSHNK